MPALKTAHLYWALPSCLWPLPRPIAPDGFDLKWAPARRQPRWLRPVGQVLRDRRQQTLGGKGNLVDGTLERHMMLARRLAKTAHLPDELPRGGADLVVAGENLSEAQRLGASVPATTIRE